MSYEGYYQLWCPNGHYWEQNVYAFDECCSRCGEHYIVENSVDETNGVEPVGFGWGYIQPEVDVPAVTETCEHCNHTRIVKQETHKIPTAEQLNCAHKHGGWPRPSPEECEFWWHFQRGETGLCPCCGGDTKKSSSVV